MQSHPALSCSSAFLAQLSSPGLFYQLRSSLQLRTPNPDNEGPLTLAQGMQALAAGMLLTGQDICSGVSRKPASSSGRVFPQCHFGLAGSAAAQLVLAGGGHGRLAAKHQQELHSGWAVFSGFLGPGELSQTSLFSPGTGSQEEAGIYLVCPGETRLQRQPGPSRVRGRGYPALQK